MQDLQILSRLLDEALDLDADQVEAWLAALPTEHHYLLPRLRRMLAERHHTDQDDFLAAGPKMDDGADGDDEVAHAGDRVGPYRLIEEVGRGGMGTVWRAERADGSWARQVALKLPRLAWGAGLVKRMGRERDFNARLEHPNIARFYDAGVDSLGRPFIAMEYIEGRHLDVYLQIEQPTLSERLRLFVRIARAIAYAHRHLVVHRDIKPSNVIISADGEPHLLDFGIAKSLQTAGETDNTALTREIGKVLTPHYASPEQLRGLDVTVGSDVYSLAVLLYEMLTGCRPHQPTRGSLAALEEAILDGEPLPASSRVQDKSTARALSGEIDAILAKALRRDVEERYPTADAFADDVERHLVGDRVLARPDSLSYRVAKGLRRHRVVFATAAAVLVAIVAGAAVALVQADRTRREAVRAQAALVRASTVKNFIVEIFRVNSRDDPAKVALRQLPAELLLDNAAGQIATKFAGQRDLQAELYGIVARILLDMNSPEPALLYAEKQAAALSANESVAVRSDAALLRGEILMANLRTADAEKAAREALTLALGSEDRVKARLLLAQVLQRSKRHAEERAELDRVASEFKTNPALPRILEARQQYLEAMLHAEVDGLDTAQDHYQKAIVTALDAEGPTSRLASQVRVTFGYYLAEQGAIDVARSLFEDAFAALRSSGGDDDVEAALLEAEATRMLEAYGKLSFDQANEKLKRDLAAIDRHASKLPAWTRASVEAAQACIALRSGRVALGMSLMEPSVRALRAAGRQTLGGDCLADALMDSGRHDEADAEFQRSLRNASKRSGENFHTLIASIRNHVMGGRYDQALRVLAAAKAMDDATVPPGGYSRFHPKVLDVAHAYIELARGRDDQVLHDLEGVPPRQNMVGDAGLMRGEALCRLGRVHEGLALMQYRLTQFSLNRYPYRPALADARARLGLCELAAGHRAAANQLARLAHEAFLKEPAVSPYYKQAELELERRLRVPHESQL